VIQGPATLAAEAVALPIAMIVVPAEAGTQRLCNEETLDSRFRGNDAGEALMLRAKRPRS
jgi:hypothetical protein